MNKSLNRRNFLGLVGGGIATMMLTGSTGWAGTVGGSQAEG